MLKGLLYLALCSNYFYVIHGGGRWNEFPEENYFSAVIKGLPTAALVLLTWQSDATDDTHKRLKGNVTLGLLFSLIGDVCMVWRFDRILLGMLFFAIAHLYYARAFKFRPVGDVTTAVTCILPGLLMFITVVIPNIPENSVRIASFCYTTVISIMWWRCVTYFRSTKKNSLLRACVGAFIFMTSDFLICLDSWVIELPFASLLIMTTYYLAQFLIATSVMDHKPSTEKIQ